MGQALWVDYDLERMLVDLLALAHSLLWKRSSQQKQAAPHASTEAER